MDGSIADSEKRWSAAAACGAILLLAALPAQGLQLEFEEVRSYGIPANFPLKGAIVESTSEGTTLVANSVGQGRKSTCTVVVATKDAARAYPYRHGRRGSACVGAVPGPAGGFFVRGTRPDAEQGEVAGFTARIDGAGRELWLVHDTAVIEGAEYQGAYRKPTASMAYSPQSGQLVFFTLGVLEIGMLGKREITHTSVVRDGTLRVPARTLGTDRGLGRVEHVFALQSSGRFLVHLRRPTTMGAQFVTYDGSRSVDSFEPGEQDWSERFVREIAQGPGGTIYVLWTDDGTANRPTRVTAVTPDAEVVWEKEFAPDAEVDDRDISLGSPLTLWAGRDDLAILYRSSGIYFRVLDVESGEERDVAAVGPRTPHRPIGVVRGPEGRLRLLAGDPDARRFRELRMRLTSETSPSDAGVPDGGGADVGADASGGGGSEGRGGGCATASGGAPGGVPVGGLAFLACAALRPGTRRGRTGDDPSG